MSFGQRFLLRIAACAGAVIALPFIVYIKTAEAMDKLLKDIEKEKK